MKTLTFLTIIFFASFAASKKPLPKKASGPSPVFSLNLTNVNNTVVSLPVVVGSDRQLFNLSIGLDSDVSNAANFVILR